MRAVHLPKSLHQPIQQAYTVFLSVCYCLPMKQLETGTLPVGMQQPPHTFNFSSALFFSSSTGSSTLYTCSPGASLLSPQPMDVTNTNFLTPFFTAASMMLMLPWLSACGFCVLPPIVETTASTSSMPASQPPHGSCHYELPHGYTVAAVSRWHLPLHCQMISMYCIFHYVF